MWSTDCYSSLSSSPLPSSSPCPSLTTPYSKATILHIVFFLPRMILAPSSSDEIPYMPKPSLNVTEFMRHSADLMLISPFSLLAPRVPQLLPIATGSWLHVYCELFTNKSQVPCIFVAPESGPYQPIE